jgi:peroxiredoxin Q/BCP
MTTLYGFLAAIAAAALFWSYSAPASELPREGQMAPDFGVMDQNGKIQHLADYRGKWLVLYFYPKDETPGCTTEACAFRDDIEKIRHLGAAVVGVSIDDATSHAEFAKNHHLPFPLLADKDGSVSEKYGSQTRLLGFKIARRNTFVIDPDGRIAKVYVSVDAGKNPTQVIADLTELTKQVRP